MPFTFSYKKILLSFLLLGLAFQSHAQGNLPYFDNKFIHFGFSLGFNTMHFEVENSQKVINGKVYTAAVSSLSPGFAVGMIGNMRLNRYFNLRLTPTLHFGSREIAYSNNGNDFLRTDVSSIPVHIPIYIKYSAERKDNYRPYILAGGGFSYDLSTDESKPVLLKPLQNFIEFGAGCDLYFTFFKFAPEIKFALGLNNQYTPYEERNSSSFTENDKIMSQALAKLKSRMITLTFNFE